MTSAAPRDAPLTPEIGHDLVANLGFLHVPGGPLTAGRAYLFVALRPRPTLAHFDPERVDCWTVAGGRGERVSIDRATHGRLASRFSWGPIEVVDRLGVHNDFVGFGGELAVERQSKLSVVVLTSAAPILASGGHSQGWDPIADEALAYFGRLRAAAGAERRIGARLTAARPLALYGAFVRDALERFRAAERRLPWRTSTLTLLTREAARLRRDAASDWAAAAELVLVLR